MSNLLKSDFYRLFRTKSFYICTFIAAFIYAAAAFVSKWVGDTITEQGIEAEMELPFHSGIYYGLGAFSDSSVHIFMAIFIAIFVTAEFVNGTMKNTVSKGFSKIKIYLSKLITMSAASIIMIVTMFVFGVIAATMVTGNLGENTANLTENALRMVGVEILLHIALTSVFVMIAMIIRNNGGTIAINIIGVTTFGSVIYQLLDLLFNNDTSFAYYGLQNNITLFLNNLERSGGDIIRAICVGVVFLAATAAIGIAAFRNSDIK